LLGALDLSSFNLDLSAFLYNRKANFLSKKETEFALALNDDMTSNFKISKALGVFDLGFDLENDFSNQEYHNANLVILSQF